MGASVIICTRNRAESLKQTLNSFKQVLIPNYIACEILVVDNGSTDNTADVVSDTALPHFSTRLVSEPIRGQAHARNTGIQAARGQIIVFTDDDVRPEPDWLGEILAPYEDDRVAAVKGRTILEFDGVPPNWLDRIHRGFLAESNHGETPIFPFKGFLVGANMSFRREVAESVGTFNTLLGPGRAGFWDDTEFSVRLMQASYQQYYQPTAIVHHMISNARLTSAYFRDVAFRNGISTFIARQSGALAPSKNQLYEFARASLRQVKWEIVHGIRRSRPFCSETELTYRVWQGETFAQLQGMRGMKRRYGTSSSQMRVCNKEASFSSK